MVPMAESHFKRLSFFLADAVWTNQVMFAEPSHFPLSWLFSEFLFGYLVSTDFINAVEKSVLVTNFNSFSICSICLLYECMLYLM